MYAVCLLFQVGGKEVFKAHFVCRLHQQQLIEVLLLSVAGTWVLSRLYSFTLLLKTHGVYCRLLREFRGFLRMDFVRNLCAPSQAAQKFNEEMKGYIRTNYKRFVRSQESSKHHWVRDAAYASDTESDGHEHQPRDRGTIRFRADLDGFFAMWNGDWCAPGKVPHHHCTGCCQNREDSLRKMRETAEQIMFRRTVPSIAANKWTKLGPVIDWLLTAFLAHGVLRVAFLRLGLDPRARQGASE